MQFELKWRVLNDSDIALVFDRHLWEHFQARAKERGVSTHIMISDAVAHLLGPFVSRRSND